MEINCISIEALLSLRCFRVGWLLRKCCNLRDEVPLTLKEGAKGLENWQFYFTLCYLSIFYHFGQYHVPSDQKSYPINCNLMYDFIGNFIQEKSFTT